MGDARLGALGGGRDGGLGWARCREQREDENSRWAMRRMRSGLFPVLGNPFTEQMAWRPCFDGLSRARMSCCTSASGGDRGSIFTRRGPEVALRGWEALISRGNRKEQTRSCPAGRPDGPSGACDSRRQSWKEPPSRFLQGACRRQLRPRASARRVPSN